MAIISTDNIASEDLLGRKKFAKQIVNCITRVFVEHKESFVIGINGPWGSGKSTLLLYIEQALSEFYKQNTDSYKIIRFNPWANKAVDSGELERDFFEALISELQNIQWKKEIEEKNDKFKSYLKYLNYLKFVKHVHPVAEKIVDAIDDYTKQASTHTLDEVKTQADKLISEKGIKIYIFLDDLDRLNSHEIAAIFKMIKLNVNFVNTCFVVAYDKAVVASSLDDMFNQRGEEYLEKIIQADFSIPEITDESMEESFLKELNLLLTSLQIQFDEEAITKLWAFYGLKEYFRTLRDIKRYMNSLLFSLPNIANDINVIDFVVLEAIKVFDYNAYQKVYNDFLVIQRRAIRHTSSFDQGIINTYINVTTKSLLEYLFIEKSPLTQIIGSRDLNSRNLRDPEYFKRYYALYISSKDISQETLVQFLSIGTNRSQIFNEALENGKIKNLLKRLSDKKLSEKHKINDNYLLDWFLKFWDEKGTHITFDLYDYLWECYFNLALAYTNRFEGSKAAVKNLMLQENVFQPMRFVFNYYILLAKDKDNLHTKFKENIADQIDLIYEQLKVAFQKHIIKEWHSYVWNAINGNSPFISRLFIYAMASHAPDEYKNVLDKYLSSENFVSFIVKSYFVISENNNSSDLIVLDKKDLLLPGDYWNKFINILKDSKRGTWSEYDQERIKLLLSSLP